MRKNTYGEGSVESLHEEGLLVLFFASALLVGENLGLVNLALGRGSGLFLLDNSLGLDLLRLRLFGLGLLSFGLLGGRGLEITYFNL